VCLKSVRFGISRKDERHVVSMSTGRWSELSAEHEVIYTGEFSFRVIALSRTSGVEEAL
jgi:hypothetical protein